MMLTLQNKIAKHVKDAYILGITCFKRSLSLNSCRLT